MSEKGGGEMEIVGCQDEGVDVVWMCCLCGDGSCLRCYGYCGCEMYFGRKSARMRVTVVMR